MSAKHESEQQSQDKAKNSAQNTTQNLSIFVGYVFFEAKNIYYRHPLHSDNICHFDRLQSTIRRENWSFYLALYSQIHDV
mmetsp:Transcript_9114/g.13212  ORF Transcript_9114/g.13212 Transcript_9114/m.13212 type:complete len:80 (+) Transcript_9114:81-320(+)